MGQASTIRHAGRVLGLGLCGLLAMTASGCSGVPLLKWGKHEIPAATEANPAVRVIGIWEPSEGQGLEGVPSRGFAGQILFFTRGSNSPVRVDGDVRIYLFDDQGTPEEQAKPIHQFDFKDKAWTVHLQNGTLGPSYHVFIPYTRRHPYQCRCSLRVRLTPESGAPVFSDTVQITLPGPARGDEKPKHPLAPELASKPPEEFGASVEHRTIRPNKMEEAAEILAEFKQKQARQNGAPASPTAGITAMASDAVTPATAVEPVSPESGSAENVKASDSELEVRTFHLTPPTFPGSKNNGGKPAFPLNAAPYSSPAVAPLSVVPTTAQEEAR